MNYRKLCLLRNHLIRLSGSFKKRDWEIMIIVTTPYDKFVEKGFKYYFSI